MEIGIICKSAVAGVISRFAGILLHKWKAKNLWLERVTALAELQRDGIKRGSLMTRSLSA